MSLETVAEDIREEARARADEIRADADERVEEILAAAESDAEADREQRADEIERQITQEREQRLSSAKLGAKQERLEARRDVLEAVREAVESEIADIDGEKREELTRTLLDVSVAEFDENASIDVYGRPADQSLLEDIVSDYDDVTFAGEYDCLGGVVVDSDSSRVRVSNTFDSILVSVWEDNLREISSRLFEADE